MSDANPPQGLPLQVIKINVAGPLGFERLRLRSLILKLKMNSIFSFFSPLGWYSDSKPGDFSASGANEKGGWEVNKALKPSPGPERGLLLFCFSLRKEAQLQAAGPTSSLPLCQPLSSQPPPSCESLVCLPFEKRVMHVLSCSVMSDSF